MTTLARLSFQLKTDQLASFVSAYERHLAPLLTSHGLVAATEEGRRTAGGVFSRLFPLEHPAEVPAKEKALQRDPAWQDTLLRLGQRFSTTDADAPLRACFALYAAPAGRGTTVQTGPGIQRGLWHCFRFQDGFPTAVHVWGLIQDRNGHLWFTTSEGVCCYDGGQLTTFTSDDGLVQNNGVWSLLEDRQGHLWFGTRGGGVSRYDGAQFTTYSVADGLAHDVVNCILEDHSGALWFGTEGGGVSRYDGASFQTLTTDDGLVSNSVNFILEDREENLWFSVGSEGVSCYNGQAFKTFTTDDGLACNRVTFMLQDREGALWFAPGLGGLSRYDGLQFTHFTQRDELLSNGVMSLLESRRGALYFGTWSGVNRFDGRQLTALDGLAGKSVYALLEDRKGHLWFGTRTGEVICFDGEALTTVAVKEHPVWCLLEDQEGSLWFGTVGVGPGREGDVNRFDGQEVETFTTDDGLAEGGVHCMLQDRQGRLWFGTRGGVSRYDGQTFETFTSDDGLTNDQVVSMLEDRNGDLWFGTKGGGVSRYDGAQFTTLGTGEGLAHPDVHSILQDQSGTLWFGTFGGGVSRYDGQVFQGLNVADGLVHDTIHDILQDGRGDFWIATEGGITRYRPQQTHPSVHIEEVIADRRYDPLTDIVLPTSQQFVLFAFQGTSLTARPEGMAYVYRLEGYAADWQVTYTRQVEYPQLKVGSYRFQVQAVDRDLHYSAPATVEVTVEPDPRLAALTEALSATGPAGEFVGRSAALRRVQEQLAQVAPTELTVLILGETGTGKGLAARLVHRLSPRQDQPFIQVNCGAIPAGLVESELFGHEKGAFTSAVSRQLGKVELAGGGTLFLDEIGDLPLDAQVKLLHLLEERTFERVGGRQTLVADVRVVAATNRDLPQRVAAGTFREDLYYRLQGFEVHLPPLRQRHEDISLLALYFMTRVAAHLDKEVTSLSPLALAALQNYGWPGNVRELQHAVERAVVVCQGTAIRPEDLPLEGPDAGPGHRELRLSPEEYERDYVQQLLEQTGWVLKGPDGVAARLGWPVVTLRRRLKKWGITRP